MFPIPDMFWSLAGGRYTITFFHIDSDGLLTHAVVVCGGKLWIFYRERKEMPLSSRHAFMDDGFRLDRYTAHAKYDLEAVYLSKGDLLWVYPFIEMTVAVFDCFFT